MLSSSNLFCMDRFSVMAMSEVMRLFAITSTIVHFFVTNCFSYPYYTLPQDVKSLTQPKKTKSSSLTNTSSIWQEAQIFSLTVSRVKQLLIVASIRQFCRLPCCTGYFAMIDLSGEAAMEGTHCALLSHPSRYRSIPNPGPT